MEVKKQKWINKHAIEDWELRNTSKSSKINKEYWKEKDKEYEIQTAKNILKYGNPWGKEN